MIKRHKMKSPKSKKELIKTVLEQIVLDVHCGDSEAIEEMLGFVPAENLIAYLPEEDWKPFYHLVTEEHLQKEEEPEIRTENAIRNLMREYPNDTDLGKQIRRVWQNYTKP
jgi:hypothetical protein